MICIVKKTILSIIIQYLHYAYPSPQRRQWHPTPVLLPGKSHGWRSLEGCSPRVAKSRTWLSDFTFTFHFHALEKEMATHSSVLAWRIPGTGEPGGLLSVGSHRVGHDWSDLAAAAAKVLPRQRICEPTLIYFVKNWDIIHLCQGEIHFPLPSRFFWLV